MSAVSPRRTALTVPSIPRGYVQYLQTKLLEAEAGLTAMTDRYERTKARFDRCYARRGITPEADIVNYSNAKGMNPELKFWYAKVEHFQREVAAYGAALTGLDAARRMLTDDGYRVPEYGRSRNNRRALNRVS
ncbi:hypothetical protein ONA91_06220 [Micromonospora sp. DR5-3]|uniref:hypothetical protein n=1 Tax=unclassified Micromonospora TaxID=2617518 RepID=UPI0011D30E8D|nr:MULTISPECIES: hypothetical protein [unclassified Micromonospora]MCW3814051.1 hypothetical protein [Micromonospora sp. DR5-3]TYC23597.1 hypothetical protein FXF52_14605 [Micromonospora sp. MP36]